MSDKSKATAEKLTPPPGAIELPSGGWALLRGPETATGSDVHAIRRTLNIDGDGDILNGAAATALAVLLDDWQFPQDAYPEPPRLPSRANAVSMLGMLRAADLMALEEAVMPFVSRIMGLRRKLTAADPS